MMNPLAQKSTKHLLRLPPPRHWYAFGSGVAAGATTGLVGWAGAQVLIPALTWQNAALAGHSQLAATGIALTSLSTSTLTSGYKFYQQNQVHVPIALLIGLPAVISARIGTLWAKKLSGDALALIFNACSIILIPTHFWIQERAKERRNRLQLTEQSPPPQPAMPLYYDIKQILEEPLPNPRVVIPYASFGLLQGVLSSLMGVGGLPLTMSFLTEFTSLEHHSIQGTAVCAVIPSILTSAMSRLRAIPLPTAGAVCLGAIVGGYGGAQLALSLDAEQLQHLYMASLVLFGGRSVVGATSNLKRLLTKTVS